MWQKGRGRVGEWVRGRTKGIIGKIPSGREVKLLKSFGQK
jgi:hypothetical protein